MAAVADSSRVGCDRPGIRGLALDPKPRAGGERGRQGLLASPAFD